MPNGIETSNFLELALQLAREATNITSPNPRVGCVIASPRGVVLGQGHTQAAGGPHAEVMALRDAATQGHSTQGAMAYVTLEPCSHHGRTGPCCDALIAAGIRKVVATHTDPNPLVAGQGFARLRAAGVDVEVLPADDPLAVRARELNIGFFSRMIRQRPWVRLKVATSLDGKTALPNGVSQWITAEPARADGHAWRARACAVLTGIGTLLHDKPRLDVRLVSSPRQPHVVVVDSTLQTPLDAPIFEAPRQVFIYCAVDDATKRSALQARGATVICMPALGTAVQVDLRQMLHDLAARQINEVHVEAGQRLNGGLLQAGLVDELLHYIAPKLLGSGLDLALLPTLQTLDGAINLQVSSVALVGPDVRVIAKVQGHDPF
jgi:diaminohydroxyphosphoribosylaminopyrimidine deaminase / 5-amino-6-(5-phosphoribosylamino)uracil reductase